MPRPKGSEKTPGSGRKKGSINKVTADMREMMYEAFERAGGVEYLVRQAKDNPRAFMTMATRLIPQAVEGKLESALPLLVLDQNYVLGQTQERTVNGADTSDD